MHVERPGEGEGAVVAVARGDAAPLVLADRRVAAIVNCAFGVKSAVATRL